MTAAAPKIILLEGLNLIIGIKGYDPGGKEWPTILTHTQLGGSISSFKASSNYFVFFKVDNKVLFIDYLSVPYLVKFIVIFLTLFVAPFYK